MWLSGVVKKSFHGLLSIGLITACVCSGSTAVLAEEILLDADVLASAEAELQAANINIEERATKAEKVKPAPAARLKTLQTPKRSGVSSKDRKIAELSRKLEKARNDLIVAEMEVERLSSIIEERNQLSLSPSSSRSSARGRLPGQSRTAAPRQVSPRVAAPNQAEPRMPQANEDMQIATITVEKANLRTGPGKKNSPLMTVAKGTRLAVEHRVGDWYRVIAPTGVRAWISGEVVSFGKGQRTSPTRTVRIKGVQNTSDDAAFDLIKGAGR